MKPAISLTVSDLRPRPFFSRRSASLFAILIWLAPASLLLAGPPNDDLKDAFVLHLVSNPSDPGNNDGAGFEGSEPDPMGIGGRSIWWKWTTPNPAPGWVEINTFGSKIDPVLYAFTSAISNPDPDELNLPAVAANNDADGGGESRININATIPGKVYYFAVHGLAGEEGPITINIVAPGTPPPPNDSFASSFAAPYNLGNPNSVTRPADTNAGATEEYAAPEPALLAPDGASVWYTWTAPNAIAYQIDTFGSDFDTLLYVFTGNSLASLTPVAADDDSNDPSDSSSNGSPQSRVRFTNATPGTVYRIAVHGYSGSTGTIALHIAPSPSNSPPPNDNFANRITLPGVASTSTTGDNIDASVEPYEEDTLLSAGATSWWSWTAPSNAWVEINCFGSTDPSLVAPDNALDTVLYVFTGNSLGSLAPVASNDDAEGNITSRVNFQASDGQTYRIAVAGFAGATGNINLQVTPGVKPPGYDVFGSKKDLGGVTTETASGFENRGCTLEPNEPTPEDFFPLADFYYGDASAWFKFEVKTSDPGVIPFVVDTGGSSFDTMIFVFKEAGSFGQLVPADVPLGVNPEGDWPFNDDGEALPGPRQSKVTILAEDGDKFRIAVLGYLGETGDIVLNFDRGDAPPPNDNFATPHALSSIYPLAPVSPVGFNTNAGATLENPANEDPEDRGGASVWYTWTAPAAANGQYVEINTFDSTFDTFLYVFTGSSLSNLDLVGYDDNGGGSSQSAVSFQATAGTTYRIAVNGFLATTGDVTLSVRPSVAPPLNDNYDATALPAFQLSGVNATASGTNLGAGMEAGETALLVSSQGGTSVWWRWQAPSTGWFEANAIGSSFDTLIYVFAGAAITGPSGTDFSPLVRIGFADRGFGNESRLNFFAQAGHFYPIAVHGDDGETGSIQLAIKSGSPPPSNDNFSDREFLGNPASLSLPNGTYPTVTNDGASSEVGEPDPLGAGGSSVWWTWESPVNGYVQIDTFGSALDTVLYVFTGSSFETFILTAANDDAQNSPQSRVNFLASAGQTYQIAVSGKVGFYGDYTLNIGPGFAPPPYDAYSARFDLGKKTTAQTATWTGINTGATLENGDPASTTDDEPDFLSKGGASLWFKFTADENGWYEVNTFGSDFNTILYVYEEQDDILDLIDVIYSTPTPFAWLTATSYLVGDTVLNGSLYFVCTSNHTSDASTKPGVGGSWTSKWEYFVGNGFNDDADGTPQSRVHFRGVKDVKYRFAVHGRKHSWGNVTLTVKGGVPIPGNDSITSLLNPSPYALTGSSVTIGATNAGASLEAGEPDSYFSGGASVWWKWTAPATGWFDIDTYGTVLDSLLYVHTSGIPDPDLDDLTQIEANEDDNAGTDASRVSLHANLGDVFFIAVHGQDGEEGPVTLNINAVPAPPSNDDFSNPTFIGAFPFFGAGSNVGATLEQFEPDPTDEGGSSVWWCWNATATQWVEVNTLGSTFDSVLYVFDGAGLTTLALRGFNDSGAGTNQSVVNFLAVAGRTYHFAVNGDDGEQGAISLELKAGVPAPPNDNFPIPAAQAPAFNLGNGPTATVIGATNAGASLQLSEPDSLRDGGTSVWWNWTAPSNGWFSVDTFGSLPDTILYIYSGNDFTDFVEEGFNDNALGVTQSQVNFLASAGTTYHIAVHGNDGVTGSINLAVGAGMAPPGNDAFASTGNPLYQFSGTSGTKFGTNAGATLEHGEPDPSNECGASVWYSWTAPSSGYYQLNTFGSDFDTVLKVFTGTVLNQLITVGFNDTAFGGDQSQVNFQASVGVNYKISVCGDTGRVGNFQLNLAAPGESPPTNDNYSGAIHLGNGTHVATGGDNHGGTVEPGEPNPLNRTLGASVWWTWTAPGSGPVAVNTFGSNFDTALHVFTGNPFAPIPVVVGANDDAGGLGLHESRVEFVAGAGITYTIAVLGSGTDTGTIALQVSMLSPYQAWLKNYPSLTGANALPFADPDSDGFRNLAELALGLHPLLNSTPAGSDPNRANDPDVAVDGTMLELHYTLNALNLIGGIGQPIEVTGGSSFDLVNFTPVIPISLGGQNYKIQTPIDAAPAKQLAILVTDPNP